MTIDDIKNRRDLVTRLESIRSTGDNKPVEIKLPDDKGELIVFPASICKSPRGGVFLAGSYNHRKALFILGKSSIQVMKDYDGRVISEFSDFVIMKCRWTRSVAQRLRTDFPVYAPISKQNGRITIAFGDALGMAGRAQLQAFKNKADLTFSRQCIHQLRKLERHPEEAIDATTWTVFQEGYDKGYSAEACHLNTPEEAAIMLEAGYTRFSMEPSFTGLDSIRDKSKKDLLAQMYNIPWIELRDKFELMFHRYNGTRIELGPVDPQRTDDETESLVIIPSEFEVLSAIRIFTEAVLQVKDMDRFLVKQGCRDEVILEISFSRSELTLTPFEHYFFMSELLRYDVHPDFLAPGDPGREHWLVARKIGGYGLSGPAHFLKEIDPDGQYLKQHVIFQDISYIVALKCIARTEADLFRVIWEQSRNCFEEARKETNTKLKIQLIPKSFEYTDDEMQDLLNHPLAEEFLTITMESVLMARDKEGNRFVRRKLFDYLERNEELYVTELLNIYQDWAAGYKTENQ